jgi:co-chaperonin GroES (HSP10)
MSVKIRPILDHVIVQDMEFGDQVTKTGIILTNDDGKLHGIKPRWGKVYAVGPKQEDVKTGEWILIEHGRWTRGHEIEQDDGTIITLRRVDVEAIIASSDQRPTDVYYAGEI